VKYLSTGLFAIMFFICAFSVYQYGDETFHPKSIIIKNYTVNGDNLNFKVEGLNDNYTIDLPDNVTINKNDEVRLSYELHHDKVIEIEEIIVNNKSVWDVSDPNRIEITITNKK
jgi:hypothetical protein